MKKTLIVLCSAIALVGCNQNRGGLGDNRNRDTGSGSSRNATYPSSSTLNRNDSSILSTNTNSIVPAPAEPEAVKPAQSGTDNYKDSAPKN